MMTMGFALMFRDGALMIWGGDPFTLAYPALLRGSIEAGEVVFPVVPPVRDCRGGARRRWIVDRERPDAGRRPFARHGRRSGDGVRDRHQRGAACRVSSSPPAPALAAFGGVMGGPILGGYPGIDFDLLPLAFVVVIIGGMGSLKGALVGSDRRRHDRQLRQGAGAGALYFTLFAPMVIMLALKPTGLYGRA